MLSAPDVLAGTTLLEAFESLPFDDSLLSGSRVTIVAAGTAAGWRRAALLYSVDGGARWTALGSTAAPGTIGRLVSVPGEAASALVDRVDGFEVELAHAEMALAGADPAALDAGANLALVGDELLQFGGAEQLSATRWRLSGLWRGRRATEAAVGTQAIGDRFVLIEPDSALSLDLPVATLGGSVQLLATGIGDTAGPVADTVPVRGVSVLPPAPVALGCRDVGDGDAAVAWSRRSRNGWRWIDGVDAPLGEEREAYRVTLGFADGTSRTLETSVAMLTVARADRAAPLRLSVVQVGALGESAPAAITLPAWPA